MTTTNNHATLYENAAALTKASAPDLFDFLTSTLLKPGRAISTRRTPFELLKGETVFINADYAEPFHPFGLEIKQ